MMFTFKRALSLPIWSIFLACQSLTLMGQLTVKQDPRLIEIDNGKIKARFFNTGRMVTQAYYARIKNGWQLIVSSFHAPDKFPDSATALFNTKLDPDHRFLVADAVQEMQIVKREKNRIIVLLSGNRHGTDIKQEVSILTGEDNVHIEVGATLQGSPAKLDYLLLSFVYNFKGLPSFIHTPGLKFDNEDSRQNRFQLMPARDQIIGDRAFHSPAVILQEKGMLAALVPDMEAINKYAVVSPDARRTIDISRNMFSVPFVDEKYTMPTGLDLNVKTGVNPRPVISYGLMDNIIAHHIHYQRRNDSTMIRTLSVNKVKFAFDLFISAVARQNRGYQQISAVQWKKYGHPVFTQHPHLTMPFEAYFQIVDSVTFHPSPYKDIDIPLKDYDDHGSWIEFTLGGMPVGGYRSAINWWNDVIHNSAFWNNARDASGFWFWGKQMKRPDLLEKAERIINFCLQAPRNEHGLFATLYNANSKTWGLQFSDPPHGKNGFFLRQSESYDIVAMSKTAAHLLDYYTRCQQDKRIVNYLRPYANWLTTAVNARGAVPSYVSTNMESSDILLYSAQPAASMWFLASMSNVTGDKRYKEAAAKIAGFLEKEILPEARWIDMEQYYSDGAKPLAFDRDIYQHQVARGNLSTIWASEGFAQLYTATNDIRYLKDGEAAIDYLCFSQCSWNPHYIYTAFPFGGFTADNADNATLLDARQAETVKPFIWYGKQLGRQDLLERGIAAARSSVVLMNLPSHKANNIYGYPNIYPFGLGPENIDHEAHPQSAMRTSPSWGEGSGVFTGLAEAFRELRGGYIDFRKQMAVGVNGINIDRALIKNDTLTIDIRDMLSGLKLGWTKEYPLSLTIRGLEKKHYQVYLNGNDAGIVNSKDLEQYLLLIRQGWLSNSSR